MIANIIIGVSAIWSLLLSRESLKQVKIESQNSQDFQFALKKQDIEQWVLREDIFVTVIPVFSYYDICLQNLKDRLMELARKEASEINL